MDNDVDAAETVANCVGDNRAASSTSQIRCDEVIRVGWVSGHCSSSRENPYTLLTKPPDYCQPDPLGPARNQRAAPLQVEADAHGRISNETILSSSSPKMN